MTANDTSSDYFLIQSSHCSGAIMVIMVVLVIIVALVIMAVVIDADNGGDDDADGKTSMCSWKN